MCDEEAERVLRAEEGEGMLRSQKSRCTDWSWG